MLLSGRAVPFRPTRATTTKEKTLWRRCWPTLTRPARSWPAASASWPGPSAAPSGPRGRNAVLDKGWGSPTVTKDGVTVAEEIELNDPYENMGAQLVKEAASKTSDVAGDGTTTATVLAEAIYREGLKAIAAGADPMALTRGIQKGVDAVVEELHKHGREDRRQGREGDHRGRHHRRQQQPRDRQEAGRGDEEGRHRRRHHHRRRQEPRPKSSSSRACSSTAATCRRTSSPIRNG